MTVLSRRFPVRASLVVLAVFFVVFNIVAPHVGVPASDDVVIAVIALIGTAIAGDTWRPSGHAAVPRQPIDPALQARIAKLAEDARARKAAPPAAPVAAPTQGDERGE